MSWAFDNVIVPKLQGAFAKQLAGYTLGYTAGIDAGDVWAIRGGVRNDSDLVWVGRAPNLGAKLSGLKTGHRTYITGTLFDRLSADLKVNGAPKRAMWEECTWAEQGKMRVLRSSST
jgi:uridylate cyclase